ncbi:MAG: hypothetical protein C5B48_01440 [Candidatus Rokuibacteriota bacterium]|nr:MAG: hypothetical protein C5B48_01440 [Candidatus Rokubacteria bacterium]
MSRPCSTSMVSRKTARRPWRRARPLCTRISRRCSHPVATTLSPLQPPVTRRRPRPGASRRARRRRAP